MRSILVTLAAVLAVAVGLAGCQSSGRVRRVEADQTPPPVSSPADTDGLSTEEQRSASRLYTAKCARCHKFYNPANYDDTEWRIWMTKMSRKARLKSDQQLLLSRYLETFRAVPGSHDDKPGKPQ